MTTKTRTFKKQATVEKPKKRKKITSVNVPSTKQKKPTIESSPLPDLSAVNIAKLLSNFMTFRSFVKNCSKAIVKVEGFMDSTMEMFNVAQQMMGKSKREQRNPFSFLLPPSKKDKSNKVSQDDEDIPIIKLPSENSKSKKGAPSPMIGNILENIDINQIFKIMQSPMFQQMLSGLLKGKPASSTSSVKDKEKE